MAVDISNVIIHIYPLTLQTLFKAYWSCWNMPLGSSLCLFNQASDCAPCSSPCHHRRANKSVQATK